MAGYRACSADAAYGAASRSNLGAILAKLGRYQEAIDQYREALKTAPPEIAPRLRFNLALAYYKSAQIPEAVAELEKLPPDPNSALVLGDCYLRTGEFRKAIALLTPFEQPDEPAVDYVLGMALIRSGQVREGQQRVDRILRRGDSAEGHFLLGSALFMKGDYPSAAAELAKAAALNPDLPSLQSYYGRALLFTGDADGAVAAFRKELASDPNDYDANVQLASILSHRGKEADARPLLEHAARLRPGAAGVQVSPPVVSARPAKSTGGENRPPAAPAPPIAGLDLTHLSKPLVLIFGSYTCPKLRSSAAGLLSTYEKYATRADFRLIYIREAHDEGQWQSSINQREGVSLPPARDLADKKAHADLCVRKLGIPFPVMVDGMDEPAEKAYAAWPSRVYVIGRDGRVAFNSYLGEQDFHPAELDAALSAAFQDRDADTILRHAIELQQSGDSDTAIGEYRAYLRKVPDNVIARSNLGAALARAGRYDEAIEEYKRALEKDPANAPVRANLALAYYKSARIAEAAEEISKVVAAQPANRQAVLLLADCDLRLGENKKVIDLLSPLERQSPDDKAIIYMLGTALIRDDQLARGQTLVDRILRDGDSAEARLLLGATKMNAQDFAAALEDLKKATELNPRLPDVFSYYGLALLATGDMAGAAAAFRQELESNPNDFVSNLQLGVVLKQDQKFGEARAFFGRALAIRPGDPGVRYQLATIDIEEGKLDAARTALERLVKESPQFTEAHVSLATVYYRLKRKEDGDRERAAVLKLNAEKQAAEPGAKRP